MEQLIQAPLVVLTMLAIVSLVGSPVHSDLDNRGD